MQVFGNDIFKIQTFDPVTVYEATESNVNIYVRGSATGRWEVRGGEWLKAVKDWKY
jgi:hypothetical protein